MRSFLVMVAVVALLLCGSTSALLPLDNQHQVKLPPDVLSPECHHDISNVDAALKSAVRDIGAATKNCVDIFKHHHKERCKGSINAVKPISPRPSPP